jgi:hypothetical protein
VVRDFIADHQAGAAAPKKPANKAIAAPAKRSAVPKAAAAAKKSVRRTR